MTAAQMTHLAELSAFAAGFYATTDPNAARLFGDAALWADILATELEFDEDSARLRPNLALVLPDVPYGVTT
jgi:hypothetical protein